MAITICQHHGKFPPGGNMRGNHDDGDGDDDDDDHSNLSG